MHKIAIVAWHEFFETVRTRMFFISLFLVPGLILALVFGADWIAQLTEREAMPQRRIALVDYSGRVTEELHRQVEAHNQANPNRPFVLEVRPPTVDDATIADEVRSGRIYAYLKIPAAALDPPAPASSEPADVLAGPAALERLLSPDSPDACELGRKDQQLQALRELHQMVNAAVRNVRFAQAGLDPTTVARLQAEVPLRSVDVRTGEGGKDDVVVRMLMPFAFMFLLFMGTMQISYGLLTSLLEEKSSRVIEVLLSALSPLQLMAGKILGVVLVGLLLILVWGGVGYYTAQARGFDYLLSGRLLVYVGLYFIPGFLLISAFLGAIGSACNTLKEAQSMASPITLINIVPLMLWLPISQNPSAAWSVALSFFPPFTPFVMVLRICADPDTPLWQLLATQLVLWLAVAGTIWAAAKIFRVGILMYGKPPSPRELLRWLRYA